MSWQCGNGRVFKGVVKGILAESCTDATFSGRDGKTMSVQEYHEARPLRLVSLSPLCCAALKRAVNGSIAGAQSIHASASTRQGKEMGKRLLYPHTPCVDLSKGSKITWLPMERLMVERGNILVRSAPCECATRERWRLRLHLLLVISADCDCKVDLTFA